MKTSAIFRIRLVAVNFRCYDLAETILRVICKGQFGGSLSLVGPVFLPKRRKLFTVNRSHHVYKKSREQFSFNLSHRLWILKAHDLDSDTIQDFLQTAGVLLLLLRKVPGISCQWQLVRA